jgi:NTP pyrophosphatase (non-canonical NTP hydrolase)
MSTLTRKDLESDIIVWAQERELLAPDNARNQFIKTVEEVGELASALLRNDHNSIIDAIGDVEVTLTILKEQLGLEQDVPLALAYNEIKDRVGSTSGGTFIKSDED